MVSYPSPGSSLPWRVALDSGWLSTCAGPSVFCTRDPGRPVCVDVSAVGFIMWEGCAHGEVLLSSRVSTASGCRAQSSQLRGDRRPSGHRHPPQKTAASPHLRPWCPPPPPQVTLGQVLPQHLRQDGAGSRMDLSLHSGSTAILGLMLTSPWPDLRP